MIWTDDLLPGYVDALALMAIAVARSRAEVKREQDPSRRAILRIKYRALCDTKREITNTIKYLKNYGEVVYIGSKSWDKVTDCECIFKDGRYRRKWQLGGHQIAAGGSTAPGRCSD